MDVDSEAASGDTSFASSVDTLVGDRPGVVLPKGKERAPAGFEEDHAYVHSLYVIRPLVDITYITDPRIVWMFLVPLTQEKLATTICRKLEKILSSKDHQFGTCAKSCYTFPS